MENDLSESGVDFEKGFSVYLFNFEPKNLFKMLHIFIKLFYFDVHVCFCVAMQGR